MQQEDDLRGLAKVMEFMRAISIIFIVVHIYWFCYQAIVDMGINIGVNESLETNVPGVFACGNVLHVHDLVDYVSEEATAAGRHAAEYVKNGGDKSCDGKEISITATGGVRYTVPSTINTAQMDDTVTVRFRVGAVYKNCYIAVYLDDKQLQHRKRPVMAPGEMEQVVLKKKQLIETDNPRTITIKIEEA